MPSSQNPRTIQWNTFPVQLGAFVSICLLIFTMLSCSNKIIRSEDDGTNPAVENNLKPHVLIISIDGFRWDYLQKYKPPHLTKMVNKGSKATSLIPCYPSKTFPNHYSIATGMYPDNHGLLGNAYYNYTYDKLYSMRDRTTVEDGRLYKGTPLWVLAEKAGIRTASYFFVGTEADIQGIQPTYYYNYDGSTPRDVRINKVLDWFKLPASERPRLVTLYFAGIDKMGHRHGPSAEKYIRASIMELDAYLGTLFDELQKIDLPINIVIVSDHGMTDTPVKNLILMESIADDTRYKMVNNGSIISIHPYDKDDTESIFKELRKKEKNFKVYHTQDVPYFDVTPTNEDWGPIQVIPDLPYYFTESRTLRRIKAGKVATIGNHGFDPSNKEMHGILYVAGPQIKSGVVLPSVKNIHIYPMVCKMLGLDPPSDIDGQLKPTQSIFKR